MERRVSCIVHGHHIAVESTAPGHAGLTVIVHTGRDVWGPIVQVHGMSRLEVPVEAQLAGGGAHLSVSRQVRSPRPRLLAVDGGRVVGLGHTAVGFGWHVAQAALGLRA